MSRNETIASIDLGNSKIRVVVGEMSDNKTLQVTGVGMAPSHGIRKGNIIDHEETISAVVTALEDAERMSAKTIDHAVIGINGPHIESLESHGVIAIGGNEITEEDVERVLETAQAVHIPTHKRVIKIIPQSFAIDDQKNIMFPIGMSGRKLEVHALILLGETPILKNIEKMIFETGVDIDDMVPSMIASSEVVASRRQKELGVALVDIGASGTTVSVFEEGIMLASEMIPFGGESVTNDLAIGLRCSIETAEKIKMEYGKLLSDKKDEKEMINIGEISRNEEGAFSQSYISSITSARYQEIILIIKDILHRINKDGLLPAGVIITGGGAKIPHLVDVMRNILGLPVQIGFPHIGEKVIDTIDDPSFATSVGLFSLGSKQESKGFGMSFQMKPFLDGVQNFFKRLLP
jgi:cell division protein FtsA